MLRRPLKILFVTSEMSPLISTGGLAEVAHALPKTLHAMGHDVRVIMPCFREVGPEHRGEHYCLCTADVGAGREHGGLRRSNVPGTEIPLYLIEHEAFFGREKPYGVGAAEYGDNAKRFCFFCQAVLTAIPQTWWKPDVVHCHDWHAAGVAIYLKTKYYADPYWAGIPVVLTIHNLAYQGQYGADKFPDTGLDDELLSPDFLEFHGDLNLLKGGITFADRLSTVSPRYAREIQTLEYGAGLDGVLRTRKQHLSGILNAVDYDIWSPEEDETIPVKYSAANLRGKGPCKTRLQEMMGLPRREVPVFGVVSRLYWQKGLDLVVDALAELVKLDLQLVVLGSGEPILEQRLLESQASHSEKVRVALGFKTELAHHIFAGSDFFLMPSRYEPCGLGQMYALAYGSIPIVRRTGGLADTVRDVNAASLEDGSATGLVFVPLTAGSIVREVKRGLEIYRAPETLQRLRQTGMRQRFSWERSSEEYVRLYEDAIGA